MDNYNWIFIVVGFLVVVGVMIWLGKKGTLGAVQSKMIGEIFAALGAISRTIANSTDSAAVDVIALVITLLEKAVYAAENAYYNKEITKDERKALCLKKFDELMEATGIVLTEAQYNIVDTLIAAACEQMGHTPVLELAEE